MSRMNGKKTHTHTYAIWSVPSLSGHAIAYRWSSLPRIHRHRASEPQGSSERVLPRQVTMDQLDMRLSFPHPLLVRSGHVETTGDLATMCFIEYIRCCCCCLHIKNHSDLYPVPSLSYSSRRRNEFPWSQAKPKKGTEKLHKKYPEKVPTPAKKYVTCY